MDLDYVANLARIELTPEEKARFADQFASILEYFEKLKAVDVSGIEPTAHAFPVENVWGVDEPAPSFRPEEAMRNAPAQRENMVVVPKVVEDA
ncbi:MAG: aspartyl-tRNA(Asn)/glutamyl-tRNA (Gln) amidotransferase subunit C [Puniceicoccaceae bacterium 5H]|nr:MAG: aspartyl-tRNA(Asn)/glutamyl-tRNA (Gln) amidotransferase subunit C [Puniceicoccaceae bacterium 5H]